MITEPSEFRQRLLEIQDSTEVTYTTLPSDEPRFIIDANSRTITIPPEFQFLGVKNDHNAETIYFEIDRYFDDEDLSQHACVVQFSNKNNSNDGGIYPVTTMDTTSVDGKIIFGWEIKSDVTSLVGDIYFSVRFYSIDSTDYIFTYNFNTLTAKSVILATLDVYNQMIIENYPSELDAWLDRMNELEAETSGKVEEIEAKGQEVLTEINSVKDSIPEDYSTLSSDVDGLKSDLEQLKQNGAGTGTGLSTEAIDILEEVGNCLAYTTADGGSKWIELISILRNSSSGGGSDETDVTLSSISATYNGGDVPVGTALNSLTGITVTGTYSNGSTSNVTGYTLSGTIAEGNNTITVSYGGKTTTFIVVGYTEQEGPNTPPTGNTEPVYELAQAITFDGTNYIDTGYILNDVDKDWSILTDFTPTVTTSGAVFNASKNANNLGVKVDGTNGFGIAVCGKGAKIKYSTYATNNVKAVIIHEKDSDKINIYSITGKVNFMSESEITGVGYATNQHNLGNNIPLTLGKNAFNDSNYYKGTINQFEIYERVLTSEEIDTFIDATWEATSEPTNLIDINTCTLGGNMSDGRKISEDYYVTDFIPVVYGNPYYANITKYISDSATDNGQYIYTFNQSKQYKNTRNIVENLAMGENFDLTESVLYQDEIAYVRLVFHKNYKDIAFFGEGLV